jgi:hypothetical protein
MAHPHAALPRPVNVLTTHSAWLFSLLVLGCNGLLSGSGNVIADLHARLFRAVEGNDLAEAKRLNDRIEPTARAFYADPFVDMHNRMKGSAGDPRQAAAGGGASTPNSEAYTPEIMSHQLLRLPLNAAQLILNLKTGKGQKNRTSN